MKDIFVMEEHRDVLKLKGDKKALDIYDFNASDAEFGVLGDGVNGGFAGEGGAGGTGGTESHNSSTPKFADAHWGWTKGAGGTDAEFGSLGADGTDIDATHMGGTDAYNRKIGSTASRESFGSVGTGGIVGTSTNIDAEFGSLGADGMNKELGVLGTGGVNAEFGALGTVPSHSTKLGLLGVNAEVGGGVGVLGTVSSAKDMERLGKPYKIETKNQSFPNFKMPREEMPDYSQMPKTLPQNKAATKIAAFVQGNDTLEKKRHGFNKYNNQNPNEQPNAAFVDPTDPYDAPSGD